MSVVDDPQAAGDAEEMRRKNRALENNKKMAAEEAQKVIAQQRSMIEMLKTENQQLKSELSLETKVRKESCLSRRRVCHAVLFLSDRSQK